MFTVMEDSTCNMSLNSLDKFSQFTEKPEKFLGVQADVAEGIKQFVKELYDFTKFSEVTPLKNTDNALPELIIRNFDEEQIWQELELQNDGRCNQFISDISLLVARKDNLKFPVKLKCHAISSSILEDDMETKNEVKKKKVGKDGSGNLISDNGGNVTDGEQDDDEKIEEQNDVGVNYQNSAERVKAKPSVVDDRFFKLRDLEKFLDSEDRKENRRQKNDSSAVIDADEEDDDDDDDDDELIDYFEDIPSSDHEIEEEDEEERSAEPYYTEFFDPPEAVDDGRKSKKQKKIDVFNDGVIVGQEEEEEETTEDVERGKRNRDKQVRFDLLPASSGSESSGLEDDDKEEYSDIKSSFEARQERLKSRIDRLEEEALSEKPWQLKGEVSAAARPQNSLLEEIVEFDLTTRPAPVITEQTTLKLEDIILHRIKDKAWDDVERKVKPVKTPNEYKKQLVMDQEKSKLSLAEVYEQEYIKQREAQDPNNQDKPEEEPKEHQEVRAMMSSLFAKLDALSNYHYTPKPVAPEVKVISNLPAISMEEVAPVATSEATLLAPEEVKAKPKGDVIGNNERTKTDMRRERRHKKAMQKHRQKERENREKAVEKLHPGLGNKYSKERAIQMLEKVTKDKNVEQMKDTGKDKGVRSSTAFFARLQEEVTSHIMAKTQTTKRKNEKKNISAKKMKL